MKDIIKHLIEENKDIEYPLIEILDFLPDATFIINKNGKTLAWNHAMEELTGIEAKDILGKSNYEYSLPFYGERRPILIDLALQSHEETEKKYSSFNRRNGTLTSEVFVPHLKKNGSYLWAKARALYNSNGEVLGAIETVRDITDKKLAEQKIIDSQRALEERVKELDCLYGVIKLVSNPNLSIDEILIGIIDLIPNACQFPDKICVRIEFEGKEYKTNNFKDTPWKISDKTKIKDRHDLNIDVHSLEEKAFHEEELNLLKEISKQIKFLLTYKLIWLQ
ncbi:MAG: PAS domain-containing protein [Candidatus Hermodarchaeota archaeon]